MDLAQADEDVESWLDQAGEDWTAWDDIKGGPLDARRVKMTRALEVNQARERFPIK